jgi:hypothetical protein
MRRGPTPYQPTDAELAALGARLFGLEEHEPVQRVSALTAKPSSKETTNAKN